MPSPPLTRFRSTLSLLLLAAGCSPEPGPALLRLTELAAAAPGEPVTLAADLEVALQGARMKVELSGARTGKLSLTARGDAPTLRIAWKLASERRFSRFRALSVPLLADGEEHLYEVDLSAEPYWTGTIEALELSTGEGRVQVRELIARPAAAGARTTALGGLSLPSLPGLRRIELRLPGEVPRRAVLEVHLGLLPRFDQPGVIARFRAGSGPEGRRRPWLDEEIAGGSGWHRLRREVKLTAGEPVILEVEVLRDGEPLPEGAAVWGAPMLVAPARPRQPHLVVLLIDTLRADVVGAYGDPTGLTPHLDRLAAGAVRFDQLLAPSPWTLPSVATLLTGLQPQTHGAGRVLDDFAPTALGPTPPTLAESLAHKGFYTAAIYNNIFLGPSFGVDRGFDSYHWLEEEDDALVDRALELLESTAADRRLFLLLHLFGPHNPYAPPADACTVARRLEPEDPGGVGCAVDRRPGTPVPPRRSWPRIEALYRAEVAFTDRQVGRFLDRLAELGLVDETVLLVVSDHGEDFWGRLEALEARGYEDADHGHAHTQELLRVVGLLRAPGLRPGVVGEPVELADLAPTLEGLVGVEAPAEPQTAEGSAGSGLDGVDLAPVLAGERTERRTLISDFLLYGQPRWAVRRGPWKLIVPRSPELAPELYNLEQDPGEGADLYAQRPDIAEALRRVGEEELARREERRRQLAAGEDAVHPAYLQWNHITKLRALGYLK